MPRKSSPSIDIQLLKKGKRTYGAIYTLPSGNRVYLAWRRSKEIFRYGEKDISSAIRAGKAAWALDDETLINLRAMGIKAVGVLDRDTGDKYLTTIGRFFDKSAAKILNYETRGGALQRYLPLDQFRRRAGLSKV